MLRAPFPYFGGKRKCAPLVWERFGNVPNYVEPFFGSGAVLLGRPHAPRSETINDKDAYVANFWRAVAADAEAVAYYADWPVSEADLHARHLWLVRSARKRVRKIKSNPDYYDAMVAGWWVYGQCLWLGSGFCAEPGWTGRTDFKRGLASGVFSDRVRRPNMGGAGGGQGVHAPTLTRQIPQLSGDGSGSSRGVLSDGILHASIGIYGYMEELATRLRRVRTCCGDWSRIVTPAVTTCIGRTGIFLDPPYEQALRSICYSEDHNISAEVREWALEHGDDPLLRIALCGYEGEHEMPDTWECVPWKAHGGYARSERGKNNREKERIWFSPHCLRPSDRLQFDVSA